MSATCKATITGTVGPGDALTSTVINGITKFDFDVQNAQFTYFIGTEINTISISSATTVTCTLAAAAGNYTLTVS